MSVEIGLGGLPNGWVWVRLGELVRLRREKVYPDKESQLPFVGMDDVPANCLRITSKTPFRNMKSAGNKFFAGDILYGRLRPYLNKVVVADFEGVASAEFIVMCPGERVLPGYLQFSMHAKRFVRTVDRNTSGDRPRINFERMANFGIPLPPLDEQRRIVARIDELFVEIDDGEAALARARADLDTWRRALLKAAVTGELTPAWRERNRSNETGARLVSRLRRQPPTVRSTSRGWDRENQTIPDTWAWTAVEQAGEVKLGRQRAPQHHTGKHMRPYLRVANVLEDALDLRDVKWMNFTPSEYETFSLQPGDILLNEGQTPDLLGRPAIYNGEVEGCCFQNTLLRFRPCEGVLAEFALLVFRHYMRSGRFRQEARITTNIAHLSRARFVAMEFPVPPTGEQAEIVRLVRSYEADALEQCGLIGSMPPTTLRNSILKAAFEGHLVERRRDKLAERVILHVGDGIKAKRKQLAQKNRLSKSAKAAE